MVSPIVDQLAAVRVGVIDGEVRLDLDYADDSKAAVDMNVVMTGSGNLVEVQATAEGRPFSSDEMQQLLRLAGVGTRHVSEIQQELLQLKYRAHAR